MKNCIRMSFFVLFISLIVGCGPSLKDAQKLGFESVEEMNKAAAKGFKTGQELAAAVKKATDLGFDSIDEMNELQSKGFNTKNEFKIAEEKRRARAEVVAFGDKCSGGLHSDIRRYAFERGKIGNAQLIIGTTISVMNMNGFELVEEDLRSGKNKLIMAGIGSFQGKDIPACVEKIELKFVNRSRGERKSECFIQAYQDDEEFQMLRGVSVFECGEMEVKIKEWVDSKGIRKLTEYQREY